MKSFNLKTIAIAATLFFAGTSISFAQHNHGSQGHSKSEAKAETSPHGGMTKKTGKHQIELVVNMMQKVDKISIYLLDKKGKTISNENITGTVMFMYKDGTSATQTLVAKGDDYFVAQLENSNSFTAMVSLKVKGKDIKANFEHDGLDSHGQGVIYTCPMHSEIAAHEPGSCPKCGMNLVKKQ